MKKFLILAPRVDLEWPPPLLRTYHSGVVSKAKAGDFWKSITKSTLKSAGYDGDVDKQQVSFVVEKVMSITQLPSKEAVVQELETLSVTLSIDDAEEFATVILPSMKHLHNILFPEVSDPADLSLALSASSDPSFDIVHAVMSYPKGRLLVQTACLVRSEKDKLSKSMDKISGIVVQIQAVLGKPSLDPESNLTEEHQVGINCNKLQGVHKILGGTRTESIVAMHRSSLKGSVQCLCGLATWGLRLWTSVLTPIVLQEKTLDDLPRDWKLAVNLSTLNTLDTLITDAYTDRFLQRIELCSVATDLIQRVMTFKTSGVRNRRANAQDATHTQFVCVFHVGRSSRSFRQPAFGQIFSRGLRSQQ